MSPNSEAVARFRIRRREEAKDLLGGRCTRCGSTDNLQFDHIDPQTKLFAVMDGLQKRRDVFFAEVAKCQLLCFWCHVLKSRENGDGNKLTPDIVERIREEALMASSPQREIASRYGISQVTVSDIKRGYRWKDLGEVR